MDEKTELIKLLLSFIEQGITAEQLKDALEKLTPAYETNRLLNQINSTADTEEIQSFVTATLADLVK
jgi:mannitol/fructose-specific phosphotransferase system IIA component (Ntr-type)